MNNSEENVITIYSHYQLESDVAVSAPNFFCAGAHPWHLPETTQPLMERLSYFSSHERFLAVGEVGIDRLQGPDLVIQRMFLEQQIEFAISINSPAIILHCVRAFDVFLNILKNSKYLGAFIFHDYNGNEQITQQLLQHPQVHFSLGKSILKESKIQNISCLPLEKIFLETDESDESIITVYEHFSNLTHTKDLDLRRQILENFQRVFQVPRFSHFSEVNT